jgi:hypothetical protein
MQAINDLPKLKPSRWDEEGWMTPPSACSARPRVTENAGHPAKTVRLAEEALALASSEAFAEEIRQFRDECRKTLSPTGQRTLRGIVRNGAVYPFEPGVLAEGELVTITTA